MDNHVMPRFERQIPAEEYLSVHFAYQVKDFPVLFNKNLVSKIVDNIKKQIDEQKEIDRKIEQKQNEIKDLIQKAMDPKI